MEKKHNTKDVRSFALFAGALVAVYSLWPAVFSGLSPRYGVFGLAVLIISIAVVRPLLFEPIFRIWMKIGGVLGFVNTRIILTLGFLAIFTPIGLVMRIFGRDPLARQYEPEASSYGMPYTPREFTHMEKQF